MHPSVHNQLRFDAGEVVPAYEFENAHLLWEGAVFVEVVSSCDYRWQFKIAVAVKEVSSPFCYLQCAACIGLCCLSRRCCLKGA